MKKHLLVVGIVFLFIGMCFQPAFANDNNISVGKIERQPRGVTFYKTFGGLFSDSGNYVQQTSDGGFIIVGEKGNVLWLIKTDSNGSMMWDKTFNGLLTNRHFGLCVQQTMDGGYIIAGYRYSSIIQEEGIWLIKTDSAGKKLWDKTFGEWDLDWDEGCCVQQTSDGGYIITGSRTEPFPSYKAVWLIKTDSNGNMEWNKTFKRAGYDFGYFVQQTSDGGYIIVGSTVIFDWEVWLIKTDNAGNMEWDKTFGVNDFCYCVQQTTDGGYILTGVTCSFGAGNDDVWLIKTDSNGSMMWDRTFGGPDSDWGYFVQQTSDGGYVITGHTYSFGAGKSDVWLIKTDSVGNMIWDRTFGGAGYEDARCVQQTTDGGYILTGDSGLFFTDVLLIKTDEYGWSKTKAVTNPMLLRLLERFPLLQKLIQQLGFGL